MKIAAGIVALLVAGFTTFTAVGCSGDACTQLADKFAECASPTTASATSSTSSTTGGGGGAAVDTCSDAQAVKDQCVLDSGVDVCKIATGDVDALKIYTDCQAK